MKDSGIEWIGEIPEDWEKGRLKNISNGEKNSIVDGPFGSAINTNDYVDEGVPLLRITNLKNGVISTDSMVFITQSHADKISRSSFKKGDIIIAKTGATVGKCSINESIEYGVLSSSCIKISISNLYSNRYYYYFMTSEKFKEALINACNGTTRDTINLTPFSNLEIVIPQSKEQQKIANFLDKKVSEIDHILEKTRESIEGYKKYKQSLITEAVTKGLNPDVEMKDSGIEWIGDIPKHWGVVRLKYLFKNGDEGLKIGPFGSTLKGKTLENGNYKIYNQANLIRNDFSFSRHFISDETYNELSSYHILPGDILFSMMGTIGKCKIMPHGLMQGIMDSHLLKARLNDKIIDEFFEYVYDKDNSSIVISQLFYSSNGSIMSGLNSTIIKNIVIALPKLEEQKQIIVYLDNKCTEIDSLISQKETLLSDLETYKKSLIYECVTGKREVD